jgi:hypothetical protein
MKKMRKHLVIPSLKGELRRKCYIEGHPNIDSGGFLSIARDEELTPTL